MTEPTYVYKKGEGWVVECGIVILVKDYALHPQMKCIYCGQTPGMHCEEGPSVCRRFASHQVGIFR